MGLTKAPVALATSLSPENNRLSTIAMRPPMRRGSTLTCNFSNGAGRRMKTDAVSATPQPSARSEEHTSELQSLMRISYAVFCLKKKTTITHNNKHSTNQHKQQT